MNPEQFERVDFLQDIGINVLLGHSYSVERSNIGREWHVKE